jgi:hypothetical protein
MADRASEVSDNFATVDELAQEIVAVDRHGLDIGDCVHALMMVIADVVGSIDCDEDRKIA